MIYSSMLFNAPPGINNMKVLYIANNIPLPSRKNNRIILTIAEKLSQFCDISFVFPAAMVFPPFSFMKKYRPLKNLKPWTDGIFTVKPVSYPRLPGKQLSYLLMDVIRPERFVDRNALPDLCHAHFVMPDGYIACKIKEKYGVPYIVSVRSSDVRHLQALGNKGPVHGKFMKALKNADQIIVHNRPQQEQIARLGFACVLIPHGIETGMLNMTEKKADSPIVISVAAELIRRKNVDWVIRAVREYAGSQKIELIIAGDGDYRAELQRQADGAPNIRFLGKISREEVASLLEKSHIFVQPSVNETFGLVYLEAAAKRNAVICHRNEGVDGLFEDGKEMMFCDGYDEMKNIFNNLVEHRDMAEKLAENGYSKVKNYVWEHVQSRYMDVYRRFAV
jgi:glycosyltransferase involved in cell wall biosynthesis